LLQICSLCKRNSANLGCELCERAYHYLCGLLRGCWFFYDATTSKSVCWDCFRLHAQYPKRLADLFAKKDDNELASTSDDGAARARGRSAGRSTPTSGRWVPRALSMPGYSTSASARTTPSPSTVAVDGIMGDLMARLGSTAQENILGPAADGSGKNDGQEEPELLELCSLFVEPAEAETAVVDQVVNDPIEIKHEPNNAEGADIEIKEEVNDPIEIKHEPNNAEGADIEIKEEVNDPIEIKHEPNNAEGADIEIKEEVNDAIEVKYEPNDTEEGAAGAGDFIEQNEAVIISDDDEDVEYVDTTQYPIEWLEE
jgi:hypothetical protein